VLVIPVDLRPSPIHGLGVFALGPLRAGEVVSRYLPPFDVQYPVELMAALTDAERAYLKNFSYLSRFTGVYVLPGDHDRYMNHSDDPNVGMNPNGNTENLALRDIAAGEELTCDYRTFDAEWTLKLGRA
jgi:SET domain-containing protein